MTDSREAPTTRKIGVCPHCEGSVLLTIRRRIGRVFSYHREAECGCGATVIPAAQFERFVFRGASR